MAKLSRVAWLVQAGILLVAWPAAAQVRFGETSANMNGVLSSGYSATFGNMTGSTHGWNVGGVATLSGSYHSPNFLSFTVSPYLNQSRANSNFQSITNASGVNVSTTIFGGSAFPGSVSYSEAYNSEGNYAIPGISNFVTHGNSNTFGINWNENLPDVPSFSAGFQFGNSSYSVYGTHDDGKNSFRSLNLHSGYRYAGFTMGAYYTNGSGHAVIPQIVSGQRTQTQSDNSAYGFNISHLLPLRGSFSAGVNRSNWDSSYLGYRSNGTIDTVNAVASVHPTVKLSLSASANYSDNLAGQLAQTIIAAGGVIPGTSSSASSNSLDLQTVAGYTPVQSMQTSAFFERRSQTFLGENYGINSYGGNVTFVHRLLDVTFNGSFNLTANTSDRSGEDTLGFSTNENYSSEILGWKVTGSFGYAQNVQTLLITYMNSYFNYSGSARRNWGYFNVSAGASDSRTALTQQSGTSSSSQSYTASMGYGPWITANGSYSKSSGQALATGAGLVPVPLPSPVLPSGVVSLYGGDSYSVALSSTPVKRLILSAAYAKANSNTNSNTVLSSNSSNQFSSLVQYQYRKLYFTSGYARLEQAFSGSGTQPEVISSYYMGISRWFNFF